MYTFYDYCLCYYIFIPDLPMYKSPRYREEADDEQLKNISSRVR